MTTLSIFTPEIIDIEAQLTALQTQLEELRQAEQTAAQLLATLADSLPRFERLGAIARIKTAVLGLFSEPAANTPTIEEIFDAECLPTPQGNRHPVRERFARTLNFEYKACTLSFVKDHLLNNAESFMQAANHTTPFQSVPAPKATALLKKQNESNAPHGQTQIGGSENAADNAASPQVSLVLGKADNIYVSYFVQVGSSTIGRVEKLSATSAWSVPGMPGIWETKEEAADALIAKREADRKLHQDTNDLLRAKYGLPV